MILTPKQITNDSETFAATFLRVLDKGDKLVPFRWNNVQRYLHQHKTGRDLVLKARQLGVSTYEQGDIFKDLITKTTRAITLCHDDTTTQILRQTADRFYEYCHFNDIKPARRYANATMATYPDFDSMHVIGTAGNTEIGRGGSYSRIHGSEVALWKDAEKILTGAMQGGHPSVLLESTANGAQGKFYELCQEAMSGHSVWKLWFFAWWWDDKYKIELEDGETLKYDDEEKELVRLHNLSQSQIKWRRNKVLELKDKFKQEYPEDPSTCFLTSGNSYFFTGVPIEKVNAIFTAPMEAEYIEGHEYYAGLDWGQSTDFTDMPVLDATTKQQVDLLHINKLAWKEQRNRIRQFYDKWHIKSLGCEMNSIGSVNFEALHDMGLNVIPFNTTNETKADICSDLYEAIHTNGWKLQNHPLERHQMNTFVSTQLPSGIWRLAADGDGHDDIVMGLAIAKWTVLASRMQLF